MTKIKMKIKMRTKRTAMMITLTILPKTMTMILIQRNA